MMSDATKIVYNQCFVHNYFDSLIKLLSDVYLAKFLDVLAKL